jgi:hypothetical protein
MSRVRKRPLAALAAGLALLAGAAEAHHSFSVFFSAENEVVPLTGVVKEFHFTNPHGIIKIVVPGANGKPEQDWTLETNSPSILVRRGWNKDILQVGETIKVQGWPARDGSNYMRLRDASRADGAAIGSRPAGAP